MTWLKLDDSFATHPKVRSVTPTVRWTHVSALCHAAMHLTDGILDAGFVRSVPVRHVMQLIAAGLWDRDELGVCSIHDYLDYNPTRASVESDRSAARKRMFSRRSAELAPNIGRSSPSPSRPVLGSDSLSIVKLSTRASRAPRETSAEDPFENDRTYLAERLGELWGCNVPALLPDLLATFPSDTVTEALRRAWDARSGVENPRAYLWRTCEQIQEGAA